jgi:hypothetical protein
MVIRRNEKPGIPWLFWPTAAMAFTFGLLFAGYQLGMNNVGADSSNLINLVFWGGLAWFSWGERKA